MIAYHGTNEVAAESIKQTGFRAGTWFAERKQDAVAFGGPYIFTVEFSDNPKRWRGQSDGWQFFLRNPIGPEMIRGFEMVPRYFPAARQKGM